MSVHSEKLFTARSAAGMRTLERERRSRAQRAALAAVVEADDRDAGGGRAEERLSRSRTPLMMSTCQPRSCMYSARLNAARIVPPMFQAVHRKMVTAARPVLARLGADRAQQRGAR